MSEELNKLNIGCYLNKLFLNHLFYADDLVLFSPSVVGLNALLRICEQFGMRNDMKFNNKKSVVMIFRSKHLKDIKPSFKINGNTIKEVNQYRYLGYIICNDLRDDLDIERQRRKLYTQGNLLLRRFHMCSIEVKRTLFNSYCTPLYVAYLWSKYKQSSINKLYIAYHNICKQFLQLSKFESTSLVCTVFNVQCCKAVIRNLTFRFMCRIENSTNPIMKSIVHSSICYSSKMRKKWINSLYVLSREDT